MLTKEHRITLKALIESEKVLEKWYRAKFDKQKSEIVILFTKFQNFYMTKDVENCLVLYDELLLKFEELSDLFVEAVGYYAHPFMTEEDLASNESRIGPDFAAPVMPHYLNYRKVSIYGGSNEIQRNVIAKAVLGL